MKDQQRPIQETHDRRGDQKQEQRPSIETNAARLPARQWARLLRQGDGLTDLPASLLEQLAQAVGNSGLTDLLRQSGAESPAVCAPDMLSWETPETEVDYIQTAPPALFPYAGWPERSGSWPRPAKPGGIRDMGSRSEDG